MNQRDWTIMIYMAGDNNLSVDMAYAMEQIKEVAGSNGSKVNLFVYYDGYSESIPTLYCDYSDYNKPRHVRSYMVRDKLYPVEGKHDENAADARSVINFVDWCVNKVGCEEDGKKTRGRKADKYALIFSGHSMGFQDIGMFKDESSDVAMGMREMNDLLQRITMTEDELIAKAQAEDTEIVLNSRDTGVILGQPLDILGFDSCVMSMLEVGYQFKEVAKTMIASEGSVPNAGWTYAKLLGNLAKKSGDVPLEDTVAEFVAGFVRSQDSYTIGGVAVDMAAWDLSKLDGLNTEFYKLTDALLQCFEEKGSTIYRQMERVLLQVHWKCQAYMYEQNVDLGDFCELLKAECVSLMKELQDDNVSLLGEIATFCDSVLGQLRSAVILSGFSGGKYQYSNGISLFFPWSLTAYEVSRENYETLDFVTETQAGNGWNAFLRKYLREVTLRTAPGPTIKDEETAPIGGSYKPAPEGGSLDLSPVILEMKAPSLNLDDHAQKIRYYSYQYKDYEDDSVEAYWDAGPETSAKIAGHEGSKIAGHEGSKIAGHEGSKIAGHEGSKIAGHEGSNIAGHEGSK
ncbi:MAG: hypothetical protein HKN33_01630, partial [Pyrinomonadaceae bacterium]|nr:hypothetical protein [Pyrinomonadaceae bacterium]